MKTISRTFSFGGDRFAVIGKFEHMNGVGEMEVMGDASGFVRDVLEDYGIEEDWLMTGEQFLSAYSDNSLGWSIVTEETGDWGVLEI